MLFGVTILLYFIKILGGSRNYSPNLRATNPSLHTAALTLQKLYFKIKKTELDFDFLVKCHDHNVTPKFVRWKNLKSKRHKLRSAYHRRILKETIQEQHNTLQQLKTTLHDHKASIASQTTWFQNIQLKYHAQRLMDKKLLQATQRHKRKFQSLLTEHAISTGIKNNRNEIISNLTGDTRAGHTLTPEQESVLRFGLKHSLATKPNNSDVIASAESIWDQLKTQNLLLDSFIKEQKIKASIKALAWNFLDFDDRQLNIDHSRIKILKDLHHKYAILSPDKGCGVVILKRTDYQSCMIKLFADKIKFTMLKEDPTLTQLTTLQNYLRTIYNRGEITSEVYSEVQPQSTKPARARGLPKIHKDFHSLPPFRPIIDTTSTAYQPLAKYLTRLLNPITMNSYTLTDSFDAANHIQNVPEHLFRDSYHFVSFDVKSLFTNVPLKKTINIILDRVYNKNLINTSLKKRTLKKLLLDCCTKTAFSINGQLLKQTDSVAMESLLGPTLASIIMTAFEDEIVGKLIDSDVIKFYVRHVDGTLIVAKSSDFKTILETFKTFHPQIQFTLEEFPDNTTHFLDLQINSSDIMIFRKPTHAGQYTHFSSFTPWSCKTAWIGALVNLAYKICNNHQLLQSELKTIKKFMSWNGFSRNLTKKLINVFTAHVEINNDTTQTDLKADRSDNILPEKLPTIWMLTIYW